MAACNKQIDPIPTEEIASQLPKQVFLLFEYDDPLLYAVKYDTTNYLVEVYYDDTTNANPYDILAKRFQFNNAGYLVNYTGNNEDGSLDETKTIHRGSDQKIQWIAGAYTYNSSKDTTWFYYNNNASGTEITTRKYTYFDNETTPTYSDSIYHQYNTENQVMENGRENWYNPYRYTYNSTGSLNAIATTNYSANFAYNSGIPNGSYDIPLIAFLGKDYYIQQLKDLYPFNVFYDDDNFSISATDPYHMTRFDESYTDQSGQVETEYRTYQYDVQQNRVSRIVIGSSDYGTDQVLFRY